MTSNDHRSLRELEDAYGEENANARRRIEQAEEHIHYYRTRMRSMQEDFYALAAREGAADDPDFRRVLDQTTYEIDHNVRAAAAVVADLEEEDRQARRRQALHLETIEEEIRRRAWNG